jgi:hypothetical protein
VVVVAPYEYIYVQHVQMHAVCVGALGGPRYQSLSHGGNGCGCVQGQAPWLASGVLPRRAILVRWSGSWERTRACSTPGMTRVGRP